MVTIEFAVIMFALVILVVMSLWVARLREQVERLRRELDNERLAHSVED